MAKQETPECCDGCIKWEQFGKDCWVYWERKKECAQKVTDASQLLQ